MQTALCVSELFTEEARGTEKPYKAGSGESQLGKVTKMNEVLRRGYEMKVSRERFGGILINIIICNVI